MRPTGTSKNLQKRIIWWGFEEALKRGKIINNSGRETTDEISGRKKSFILEFNGHRGVSKKS